VSAAVVGKVSVVLALAGALALSFVVSPAGSATAAGRAATWLDCRDAFSAVEVLTGAAGEALKPEPLGKAAETGPQKGRGDGFTATVPTSFHVVHHANGSGNVPTKAIHRQLQVLQGSFAGFEGGAVSGFDFTFAGITRTANTAWHNAGPGSGDEHAMKQALHQGGDNTLNVYLTSGAGFLGWAYFPSITDTPEAYLDGIVVDWRSMLDVSTQYQGQYDLGETVPHEVGHWLNLHHTFQGGCTEPNDAVADTPAQSSPTNGCPIGRDSCPLPGLDPIHNYMDYSYDSCYTEFTPGQVLRMHDAWLQWRAN
jgi:hypothetical protein